jgi:hypothetical protein
MSIIINNLKATHIKTQNNNLYNTNGDGEERFRERLKQ